MKNDGTQGMKSLSNGAYAICQDWFGVSGNFGRFDVEWV